MTGPGLGRMGTGFVGFAMVTAIYLVSRKHTGLAFRMDEVSRWAFPGAFAAMSLFVFLT